MRWYCLLSVTVRSVKRLAKRRTSNASIIRCGNGVPILCAGHSLSVKMNTGMRFASGCSSITTIGNSNELDVLHQSRLRHYRVAVNRLTAILMCRSAGRMHSTSALKSISEAQEWCYETLGIE